MYGEKNKIYIYKKLILYVGKVKTKNTKCSKKEKKAFNLRKIIDI